MAANSKFALGLIVVLGLFLCSFSLKGNNYIPGPLDRITTNSTPPLDTIPLKDRFGDHVTDEQYNPFDILPSNIEQKVEYDLETDSYIIYEKIGDEYFRTPTYLTFDEYLDWSAEKQRKDYFEKLGGLSSEYKSGSGRIDPLSKINLEKNLVDRLFGGNDISIEPQGNIDLTFGADYQKVANPNIDLNRQSQGPFLDFDMGIKMNVEGNIGDKMNLGFNYDTNASFDFDRKIKLAYDSEQFSEDDIIKKIEAGNVSLPLRSTLIQGAQELFGLKTELQFGNLKLTAIASQQRSKQETVAIQNGSTVSEFEIRPDEYDENRHFFISNYHRDNYETALSNMPYIKSNFRVSNIEVWISDNQGNYQQNQTQICAIADIAVSDSSKFSNPNEDYYLEENRIPPELLTIPDNNGNMFRLPDNRQNDLYQDLINDPLAQRRNEIVSTLNSPRYNIQLERDAAVFQGRKLSQGEYSFNPELGVLSLNVKLRNDQSLAVAYEYFYTLRCDEVYKVGSLSDEAGVPNNDRNGTTLPEGVLLTKLLKGQTFSPKSSTWDLMMKNVYPMRTSQLDPQDFYFDIFYEDDRNGSLKKYLPEDGFRTIPLLNIFGLDNLNSRNDPQPDGVFDFVPGVTVVPSSSSIVFPVLEPFGSSLDSLIGDEDIAAKYSFQELYDETVVFAREQLVKNKFVMVGRSKNTTASEYSLGAWNIPEGSVTVRAGSKILQEGADYEVDYAIGRVRILNESYLQQGVPINISYEDNSVFSLQQKTMLGLRAEYEVNENFYIGGTYLRLFERPFTQKVNVGDDPINNRVFGLDMDIQQDAPGITRLVDKLPFYSTNAPSSINFTAEVAALKPGHASAINIPGENKGVVSVDDFEGAVSGFPLSSQAQTQWVLASTPKTDDYPEAQLTNDSLVYGANRANLSWYVLDQTFIGGNNNHSYTRNIQQQELFDRQIPQGVLGNLQTFDINYYPGERGPYNFDIPGGYTGFTAGANYNETEERVELDRPETRWAGIMRYMPNTDFQATNYEFIEFWMMNPYLERPGRTTVDDDDGYITFHLGNVSEDILKDGSQFYENALPTPNEDIPVENTVWGRVPITTPNNNGFDLLDREVQDVGLDGLNDLEEQAYFQDYLDQFPTDPRSLFDDPANDNYVAFNDTTVFGASDLLRRYSKWNNSQGNSPDFTNQSTGTAGVSTNRNLRGQPRPDQEDLNNDRSLDQGESFFEYKIPIKSVSTASGIRIDTSTNKFIRDVRTTTSPDGVEEEWYRFRIPISEGTAVGGIQDFRTIRFMRMIIDSFSTEKTFRLADFELIRNQWRRLPGKCGSEDGTIPFQGVFNVDAVGIEENGNKTPFRYVLPRGIQRERLFNTFSNVLQDEKSLVMRYDSVGYDCEASVYKLNELDLRVYEKLQMFVHGEKKVGTVQDDGQMAVFIRLGKDFDQHYYEYMIPLTLSDTSLAVNEADYIWPVQNMFNFKLNLMTLVKKLRNVEGADLTRRYSITGEDIDSIVGGNVNGQVGQYESIQFEQFLDTVANQSVFLPDGHVLSIIGNPNLGKVKGVQIGIRNIDPDSPLEGLGGEVWVNELRLTGLQERAGYAGLARLDIQMADLGAISASGGFSTLGWGSLDNKLHDRALEATTEWDVATNLELGKFFPDKWGLRVPFYAQYSKSVITPEYDAYDFDITVEDEFDIRPGEDEIINSRNKTINTIKTFNLTNVRKERNSGARDTGGPTDRVSASQKVDKSGAAKLAQPDKAKKKKKPMPWDIENLSASYAYTEVKYQDPIIELDNSKDYKLGLDYGYSTRGGYIQPFKKLKPKALALIKEINFNPVPNSFSFSSNINRFKASRTYRQIDDDPQFRFDDRRFEWERSYDLNWSLTKSLKMNFSAFNESYIDELRQIGYAENPTDRDWVDELGADVSNFVSANPDTVSQHWKNNLRNGGRNTNYNHQLSLNYTVPMKHIPYMDWIDVKAQYRADYNWAAGALITLDDGTRPGAVIQNGQNRSVTANFNFDKLYNKSSYLKSLDRNNTRRRSRTRTQDKTDTNTRTSQTDRSKQKKKKEAGKAAKIFLRPLLALRSVRLNYKEDFSTVVPGFLGTPKYLGMSSGFSSPGAGFVLGQQPDITFKDTNNWLYTAANNGWITNSNQLNQEIIQTRAQNLEAKVKIEPWKDLKIDVDFKKSHRVTHQEEFKNKNALGEEIDFQQIALRDVGSFEMTYFVMNTLFGRDIQDLFETFENHRSVISYRLENEAGSGSHEVDGINYAQGYGKQSSQVLVPAFLAAYTDQDPNQVNLDLERDVSRLDYIPKPNWSLRYNGLSKLPWFKDRFSSFTVEHGYSSTLRVNNFSTDVQFDPIDPYEDLKINGNYYSRIEIPAIQIQEQFNPIIGVSLKTKKDLNIEFEYNKTRNLDLSVNIASELNETKKTEFVFGFGYTLKDSNFLKKKKGRGRSSSRPKGLNEEENTDENQNRRGRRNVSSSRGSDMTFMLNVKFSDDQTLVHEIDLGASPDTARGQKTLSVSPSVDYILNENLTIRAFVDYSSTQPYVTTQFPVTSINGGITLRMTLN